jgi:octaprenyl-diphosphate synthase
MEGKVTLPLIYTLLKGNAAEQAAVRRAIIEKNSSQIERITSAVRRCGALDYTRARARHYHDMALEKLLLLPASNARSALERITELSLSRDA